MIRLSDFVIDYFYKIGIRHVFTVSGGGSIFLCDSLHKSKKIQYIPCHHEQAVSFAAESYARQKNKISGAVVTTGPGGTNTITGVSSCWIDSIPTLFVSGQVFLNQTIQKTGLRQLGVQEIDIISLVKPVTKYSVMIQDPNEIEFHLDKAVFEATSGRPGPVWIDIPANIQNAMIDKKNLKKFLPKNKIKNLNIEKEIKFVAKKLMNSKRPLLHFGHGVNLSNSNKIAEKLVNTFKIPFSLTWNASDVINSKNKFYCGRPGAFAERGSNFIVQNSDFFLSIGSRLPFMVTGYNSKDFARNAYRVVVDIDKAETNKKDLDFQKRIVCDAGFFIKKLFKQINKINIDKNWLRYCKNIRMKYPIVLPEFKRQKNSVNSYFFIDKLSDLLNTGETIVTDMGLSFVGTHQTFRCKKNQKLYTNSGHAPMGWGLPAAIGASFAKNKSRVICISGDGGLQMNIQELATVMHFKLPIKLFIFNNGGYLTIKQTQELGFNSRIMGSNSESGLSFPNYKYIAKSYKIKYSIINSHKMISKKISKVLDEKGPSICEIIIDENQEQMPKAINRRNKDGKSIPTTFEDMYPFLSKTEIENSTFKKFLENDGK